MDVRREIDLYALPEDRPVLHWLFDRYHWESQWRFVAACTMQRYGTYSYEVHRVWAPTPEGRAIHTQMTSPWKPIATAPRDRVILTDQGVGLYQTAKDLAFWAIREGWFTCSPHGDIYEAADEGIMGQRIDPAYWMDIPTLPTGA